MYHSHRSTSEEVAILCSLSRELDPAAAKESARLILSSLDFAFLARSTSLFQTSSPRSPRTLALSTPLLTATDFAFRLKSLVELNSQSPNTRFPTNPALYSRQQERNSTRPRTPELVSLFISLPSIQPTATSTSPAACCPRFCSLPAVFCPDSTNPDPVLVLLQTTILVTVHHLL